MRNNKLYDRADVEKEIKLNKYRPGILTVVFTTQRATDYYKSNVEAVHKHLKRFIDSGQYFALVFRHKKSHYLSDQTK